MMNGMSQNSSKLLPYVSEEVGPPAPIRQGNSLLPAPGERRSNGLAIASLVASLLSVGLCLLIVPSMLGIALGVGALVLAAKRGLPKKLPIVSIVISFVTLMLGAVGLVAFLSYAAPETDPYVPAGYTYDSTTGIAYKYDPKNNIPCNEAGECLYTVTLYQIDGNQCADGGTFKPNMKDIAIGLPVMSEEVPFPGLKVQEPQTLNLSSTTSSAGRLVEEVGGHPIYCNP